MLAVTLLAPAGLTASAGPAPGLRGPAAGDRLDRHRRCLRLRGAGRHLACPTADGPAKVWRLPTG